MAPKGKKKPGGRREVARKKAAESEKGRSPSRSQRSQAKTNKESFYIVGIGASAGGLEAFEQFFTHMPETSGMAFILVPHLDPTHKSIMPDLLRRYTRMPIFQAEDGMKVKPNCVYTIPPNRDMSIFHGTLQLMEPKEARGLRHPIDFFFRSLAEDQRERAICIVLSGTGTEGALGLRAIKGEGGLAIVQELGTAKYDGMPASAIATGLVDYVLPPEKMPEQLRSYVKRVFSRPFTPLKPEAKPTDMLQKIFILIRAQTGHDFSLYKHNTVLRRIERRMAIHQVENIADYAAYLRSNAHEVDELFKELLIRVTNFFRDTDAFEVLKDKVLPGILKNRPHGSPVRIWVPGCSTGEEAFSIAIIFNEYLNQIKEKYRLQIFATDIDSGAIEMARSGVYSGSITVDVSPERLRRFFIRKGNAYKIREEIRETVIFAVQDLIKDPPFSKLDLISCRNLLIYLSSDLQKRILPLFHYALNPDGILFLGSSESIGDHADLFSLVDKKWKVFKSRKLEAPTVLPAEFRVPLPPKFGVKAEREKNTLGEISIGELTERLLVERYSPPCAVVNEKGDILYLHGRTGKYLEPAPGKATLNILEMAREGLRLELRSAIRKALSLKEDVAVEGLQVRTNGGSQTINLTVSYVKKPEYLEGLLMAVFRDVTPPKMEKTTKLKSAAKERASQRTEDLEYELKSTKEHLQIVIEELETSNEELKSMNEELQSSNEELQSTNEEFETSKEELQSVNEELVTVNSELQNKIDELSQVNNDMINLLASTQIATIFLGNDLRIKRFTPPMTAVFKLIQTDVGRPISDIVSRMDYADLVQDTEEVIKTLSTKEEVVRGENGAWFLIRIMPYRTIADVIDGVVVTFIDVTEQKKAQETLQDALNYSDGIIETVREPLVILDAGLRIRSANKSFYTTFRVTPEETENRLIYDLGNRQWDIPALRELLEKILSENVRFEDFEVEHTFPTVGRMKMALNARRFVQQGKQTEMILLAMEDVTDRR